MLRLLLLLRLLHLEAQRLVELVEFLTRSAFPQHRIGGDENGPQGQTREEVGTVGDSASMSSKDKSSVDDVPPPGGEVVSEESDGRSKGSVVSPCQTFPNPSRIAER